MTAISFFSFSTALVAEQPSARTSLSILYPKHNTAVGKRVNLVLDPATDWSGAPYFQVLVNRTEYPVVDASAGRHAFQGLALERGLNTITVRTLALLPSKDTAASTGAATGKTGEKKFAVVQSRSISVYNQEGSLSVIPPRHRPAYFHTREGEAECTGCHRLEVEARDRKYEKPQDVLCHACHRDIPSGTYIHGPAAVWNCLACHDPDRTPVRYQFEPADLWRVNRTVLPAEPAVFIISADALFVQQTASLKTEAEAGSEGTSPAREKQRELFQDVLEYAKLNPLDRIRVEAHGSDALLPGAAAGKGKGAKDTGRLTDVRAQVVAKVLREYGIADPARVAAFGMGTALPKAPGEGGEARALNERIEIIISPLVIPSRNSLALPVIADRERVVLDLVYSKGPAVRGLKVVEQLPQGVQYVKGSATVGGRAREPQARNNELVWQLGDRGENVQETLTYLVKKDKDGYAGGAVLRLTYVANKAEERRIYDPAQPERQDRDVKDVCARCHQGLLAGPFKHGPADAGYCTICHDPHASGYPAWTRDQDWRLCTTCHEDKKTEPHLISGFVRGISHPTQKAPDPSRPGKRMSCVSCHSAHSGQLRELLGLEVRSKFETCKICHRGK